MQIADVDTRPVAPASATGRPQSALDVVVALALVAALLIYVPTYLRLYNGPWQTEQEGHGPLIMLASAWLAWRQRDALRRAPIRPAYFAGWTVLAVSLATMAITRSQDLLVIEAATQIGVILAVLLLGDGWAGARVMAFPLVFLIFAVPPPGWAVDVVTVPLKGFVSDVVAEGLYRLGYPVAQNGVVLMVGPYELMVKDACSGMNSIFALSAIGVFYIHEFVRDAPFRAALLAVSIVPITILANILRVAALVLIAYYLGADAVEGALHDFTGIFLFVVAIALFFGLDLVMISVARAAKLAMRPRAAASGRPA